ncbi:MAG TPA: hypothetical protein VFD04_02160 [Actinomycetes bacterium]|nr:hypothetical protein [Actinomycetes bacterium]
MSEAEEVERLFGLAPEAFVAARDQAAARLKRAGDAEAAARVKALRRPSLAAWAVNQLARTQREDLDRLLEAGARLRAAHQSAVAGGGAAELRTASTAERQAAAGLVQAALQALRSAGHPATEATRERIAASLHAAAADPQAAELVGRGQLTRELDPSGFGTPPDGSPSAAGEARARRAGGRAGAGKQGREGRAGRTAAAGTRAGAGGQGTKRAAGRGTQAGTGARAKGKPGAAREGKATAERQAAAKAERQAAMAAWDDARKRARLAADQAVLATRQAERLGRLADQAEREAARARSTAEAAIDAAAAARDRAAKIARELADAEARLDRGD